SGADGSFKFPAKQFGQILDAGVYNLVCQDQTMRGCAYHVPVGTKDALIVLKRQLWRITGRVIDANSKQPVDSFSVTDMVTIENAGVRMQTHSFSSQEGVFFFEANDEGEHHLLFSADGYQVAEPVVNLNEDSPTTVQLDVEMQPNDGVGSIAGTIVPPDGVQVVHVNIDGVASRDCQNNSFIFENLPIGKYAIVFYAYRSSDHTVFPLGILSNVEVRAGERVNLGRIDAAQLQPALFMR
ncbi:carboxypeptidase-like regulatory domain-containing protein, partial [bacterium]|nr:carboxypeptidase-like regulatory domain-containing protein [bacterium]